MPAPDRKRASTGALSRPTPSAARIAKSSEVVRVGQSHRRGRHLAHELPVLVDPVRDRADVVRRGLPRDAHEAGEVVADTEAVRSGRRRAVGRVEPLEEARVLHVGPAAAVAVVVVAARVEDVRLELLAGQHGGHQVEWEVADVPALADVRRRPLDRPEDVHELVHGHHRAERVALVCVAGVEVDDREAGKVEAARAGSLPAHVVKADLAGRAVVVDEVGLLGLVEADFRHHPPDLLEGAADAADPTRQLHVRDVEGAERARAPGGREEVETGRPRRVLAAPPGVERGGVADDPRRELEEAVGGARRSDVGDMNGVGRRRVGQSVDARRGRSAPGNGSRGVRGDGRNERDGGRQRREPELHAEYGTRRR